MRREAKRRIKATAQLAAVCLSLATYTGVATAGISDYFKNGFKVGPNYTAPSVWVSEGWMDQRDPRITNKPPLTLNWWEVFQDPVLYQLQCYALHQNLSIAEAVARIDQAEANRAFVSGLLLPQVQRLTGSYAKIKVLEKSTDLNANVNFNLPDLGLGGGLGGGNLVNVQTGGGTDNITASNLGFQVGWELDFWGKYRRSLEASDAAVQSTISASDAVVVLITGQIAESYIDYRTFEALEKQAKSDLQMLETIVDAGPGQGMTSQTLELNVFKILRDVTKISLAKFETGKQASLDTLGYLCAYPPGTLKIGKGSIPVPPKTVAVGIPCDLVRRRPDVVALERIAQVQSAQIGVVEADFYPSISIAGAVQASWKTVGNLVNQSSTVAGIGPTFSWTILDYCRTKNRLTAQEMAFQQAVFKYQDTVLKANAEANTAITAYLNNLDALKANKSAADTAENLTVLSSPGTQTSNVALVYSLGIDAYTYQYILARGAAAKSLVSVYKALGGGWEVRLTE